MRAIWIEHLLWCVPVIVWVNVVCRMPLWIYVLAMVIPANGILLIRSFAEHRARPRCARAHRDRRGLVDPGTPVPVQQPARAAPREPAIPWYRIQRPLPAHPRAPASPRTAGSSTCTYFEVARRFLFRPHDVLLHPTGRVPRAAAAVQAGSVVTGGSRRPVPVPAAARNAPQSLRQSPRAAAVRRKARTTAWRRRPRMPPAGAPSIRPACPPPRRTRASARARSW